MKPSLILYASLAVNAALAAWLVFYSLPDAAPADAIAAPASTPKRKAVATAPAGPAPAFPPPPAFAPAALPVAVPSPLASAAASSSPADHSADGSGSLPPLSTVAGSPPVPGRAVDSAAPGNFIRFRGMRAAVAGSYESGKPGDRALAMDLSPEATSEGDNGAADDSTTASAPSDSGETASTAATRAGSETAENGATANRPGQDNKVQANGMTREDELFRMKWGWAAYDAAQREARKEAGK